MYTETEGIILKQTKIVGGRRMLVVFTKKYGKISAGSSINEKGRNKSALVLRPFTYGKYDIYKSGDKYHINGGEVLSSHYRIGEDIDKYMCASYVMEFTEKLLPEDGPAPELFLLLSEFLDMMERRSRKYETLVAAYQMKALKYSGSAPRLDGCILCGNKDNLNSFSISDGGLVCSQCRLLSGNEQLINDVDFDIVNVLRYLTDNPLSNFERLALDDRTLHKLQIILKGYLSYHLDINSLKSEELMDCR